jgi:hypothetical protein
LTLDDPASIRAAMAADAIPPPLFFGQCQLLFSQLAIDMRPGLGAGTVRDVFEQPIASITCFDGPAR